MFCCRKGLILLRETEMSLDQALESAGLVFDIRSALHSNSEHLSEGIQHIDFVLERAEKLITDTPEKYVPEVWRVVACGLRLLSTQLLCLNIARGGDGNLLAERGKQDVLLEEFRRLLSSDSLVLPSSAEVERQIVLQKQPNFGSIIAFLLLIPLPPLYWQSKELNFPARDTDNELEDLPSPILRLIAFLDNSPIVSPQLIKANTLYPLAFKIRGITWPHGAVRLKLDMLTTCPRSEFSISDFHFEKPNNLEDYEYQGELSGQIKFVSGQSSLLDDLVFRIRGAFEEPDGTLIEIPVIGHNELRVRVVDDIRHPLMTGNRRLDSHVEELTTRLLQECPKVRDELPDLMPMLQAIARLLATYAQEAIYKGRKDVQESEFQTTVLRDLRFILGQEVQEHPKQAGGIPDIKYRGVIVELKVEDENGERKHLSEKYTAQPTQYSGAEARQTSIVVVLDLTTKDKPPGDIRNDIILTSVETHGGSDVAKRFPSKAFVFVINGNMKSPSEYSR